MLGEATITPAIFYESEDRGVAPHSKPLNPKLLLASLQTGVPGAVALEPMQDDDGDGDLGDGGDGGDGGGDGGDGGYGDGGDGGYGEVNPWRETASQEGTCRSMKSHCTTGLMLSILRAPERRIRQRRDASAPG